MERKRKHDTHNDKVIRSRGLMIDRRHGGVHHRVECHALVHHHHEQHKSQHYSDYWLPTYISLEERARSQLTPAFLTFRKKKFVCLMTVTQD